MKKLERLTLKELENSVDLLDREESIGLKGGDNGADEYYARYGTSLPSNTGYNPATDQCYSLGDSSQNQTPTTNMIGECGIVVTTHCCLCEHSSTDRNGVMLNGLEQIFHYFGWHDSKSLSYTTTYTYP